MKIIKTFEQKFNYDLYKLKVYGWLDLFFPFLFVFPLS